MDKRVLKLSIREVLYSIMIDLHLDTENFNTFKFFHETEFDGLSFRQAKKKVINDLFTNKEHLDIYLKDRNYELYLAIKSEQQDENYIISLIQVIQIIKTLLFKM